MQIFKIQDNSKYKLNDKGEFELVDDFACVEVRGVHSLIDKSIVSYVGFNFVNGSKIGCIKQESELTLTNEIEDKLIKDIKSELRENGSI